MHSLKLVLSTLMLLLVGAFAQAGTYSNNFATNFNYLTSGVQNGSAFDGLYIGNSDITYSGTAANQGNTTVADANVTSNGVLSITSVNTDFGDGPNDDGFFLYKIVPGDFSMAARVVTPFANANFNQLGIMARAFRTNGQALAGGENWVLAGRFDEFGYANIFRSEVNSSNPTGFNSGVAQGDTNTLWIRIDRTAGTNFAFYQGDGTNWTNVNYTAGSTRADLAGLPMQVGISHSTFNDTGAGTSLSGKLSDFSVTSTDFDAWAPAPTLPITGLTVSNLTNHNIQLSWTNSGDGTNTLVVLYTGITGTNTNNYLRYAPANGFDYPANNIFGSGGNLATSNQNSVVFSGVGNSVIVSNLIGQQAYRAVVYAYNGTGTNASYLHVPAVLTFNSPAQPVSLTLSTPTTPVVIGSSRIITATLNFDSGSTLDVTASANIGYSSTNAAVANVLNVPANGKGRLLGLSAGNAAISAVYSNIVVVGTNTNITTFPATNSSFSVVGGVMTHRWSFNEPTLTGGVLTTNVSDSLAGANGQLIGGNTNAGQEFLTWPGNGQLQFDGVQTYVQLPGNLFTNNGSFTAEAWMVDNAGPAARILDAGSDTTHLILFSDTVAGSINAGAGATTVTGGRGVVSNGSLHQVVWTQGGAGRRYSIYVDGLRTALNTNALLTPEQAGPEPIITFGKGQNNAFFLGALDELRTYNYELDNLSVSAHAGYGVGTTNNDPGNLTAFSMTVPNGTNMVQDDSQTATVTATFSGAGSVNVTTATNVAYSSGNTNVVTINTNALVTAILPGDSFIQAVGTFPLSSPTTMTSTLPIHVSAVTPTLQHRWSFNGDTVDSITAIPSSPFNISFTNINGQNEVVILPTNGQHASSYIQLPNDLLIAQSSVSIEAWYTERVRRQWGRVWDIGSGTGNYLFQVSYSGANNRVAFLRPGSTPGGEQQVNGPWNTFAIGAEHHLVYTLDAPSQTSKLYIDGVLYAVNTNTTDRGRDLGSTPLDYLGRSQFGADPDWDGMINEVRIYNYALSPFQVLLNGSNPDENPIVADTNAGALSTVGVQLSNTTMVVGQQQQAQALANYASVPGVPVTYVTPNWVSSDNTVLHVSTSGLITAVGAGTATVSVNYSNVVGTSLTITNTTATPVLGHRWSFNGDLTDPVGGATGINAGSAVVGASTLTLTGASNSYVRLPGHLFDTYTNATFEWWAATIATSGVTNANNTRILDFGSDGVVNPPNTNNWFGFSLHGAGIAGTTFRWATDANGIQGQHTYDSQASPVYDGVTMSHYVWTFDTTGSGQAKIYVNGRLFDIYQINQFPIGNGVAFGPAIPSTLTNDVGYIGHGVQLNAANQSAFSNFFGTIGEVRIWNGAMDQVQVQTSFQKGQDAASPIDPGALSSISTVLVDSTMVAGTLQRPRVTAQFASAANVDLTSYPGVGFSSSDTNKVQVVGDNEGGLRLKAVGAGAANIITSFGGKSATNAVTVIAAPALQLTHRWQFNSNAVDFIGNATGALLGQANIQSNGVLVTGTKIPTTYVDLGSDLVSGYDKLTMEMFVDVGNNGNWANVFAWGERSQYIDNGLSGLDYSFTTPFSGGGVVRTGTLPLGPLGGGEIDTDATLSMNNTRNSQIVLTLDSTANIQTLYTNGALARVATNTAFNNLGINDRQTILGRSFFNDPNTIANIKDFRIYYGIMTSNQVASSFALGADPESPKIVSDGAGNVIISWPDDGVFTAGYHLQRTLALTPTAWQNVNTAAVTNTGIVSVTLPASVTNSAYFRLAKP